MFHTFEKFVTWLPSIFLLAILLMVVLNIAPADRTIDLGGPTHADTVFGTTLNTVIIVGFALLIAAPMALASAILSLYMGQQSNALSRHAAIVIRKTMDIGASVPRLVWGITGAVVFGGFFGLGFSAATGVAALSCMMAPILFTSFFDSLNTANKQFSAPLIALGIRPHAAFWTIQFRASFRSIILALVVAAGRGLGDAAVLMLTSGWSMDLIDGIDAPASTLAVQIYVLTMNIGGGRDLAMAAAGCLLILTFCVQSGIWALSERTKPYLP